MKTCKWKFKYVERGRIYYTTECGKSGIIHQMYRFCPYCGNALEILKDKENQRMVQR